MTESQRPALMRWLNENCQLNDSHFEHRVEILMDLKEAQGDYQSLSEALRQLAPYGQGNPPLRFYLENVCLKYMEFFKPKRDDNNQQIDILLKPRPIRVKKDRQRWTVVGHFETTEESKQTFCVFWRNFDRVRREWRLHNYYTLEVELRCKQDREFMDVNHFLVVRDCWQELDKVQPPRLGRYKPGAVAAILQRQNMLPSLQPDKLLTRENPKMKMKSDEVNYRLAQLALKYPYRKERGEK